MPGSFCLSTRGENMNKILIIDDEEDFCFFVKANLELNDKYHVITATEGKGGIRAAWREEPDLILLDIIMPKMDGLEVLTRLKKNRKTQHIPVVVLTAKKDDECMDQAISSYSEQYLVKPVEMAVLESKIEQILSLQKIVRGLPS